MKILSIILALFGLIALAGCVTTVAPVSDGTTTATKAVNWEVVNLASRTSAKYATKLVLDKNPKYTESVASINAALATVFVGTPTTDGVRSQLLAVAPGLSAADASLYASALMDAYTAYVAATGNKQLLAADEHVQALVAAITTGIAEGVALHAATASTQ